MQHAVWPSGGGAKALKVKPSVMVPARSSHSRVSNRSLTSNSSRLDASEDAPCSVVEVQTAINRFIAEHDERPRPVIWRTDTDRITAARARG